MYISLIGFSGLYRYYFRDIIDKKSENEIISEFSESNIIESISFIDIVHPNYCNIYLNYFVLIVLSSSILINNLILK